MAAIGFMGRKLNRFPHDNLHIRHTWINPYSCSLNVCALRNLGFNEQVITLQIPYLLPVTNIVHVMLNISLNHPTTLGLQAAKELS